MTEYKCGSAESCQFGEMCKPNFNIFVCSHYKAEEPMTNEEWFCQLSTEEKADFLAKKCSGISCKFFLGEAEEIFSRYWVEWLKKPYQRGDTE